MTEPKKRGRPRKVVKTEESINPDCEQATKGYVKALIRSTRDHTHEQMVDLGVCGSTAAIGWGATLGMWLLTLLSRGQYQLGNVFWFALTVATVCSIMFLELNEIGCSNTQRVTQSVPLQLKRGDTFCCTEWSAAKQEAFGRWWYSHHGTDECE